MIIENQSQPNSPSAAPLIEASQLRLAYGRRSILRGVSLTIRSGQFWFFVGTNGAGKSTLFKAMLGSLVPISGRIVAHIGHDQIGFVPQRCDFNASLPTTVREFVSLGLVGVKERIRRADRHERLQWALQRVGLKSKIHDDYWSLSGGQRQAALVARALIRRPKLILADEPTNGLDLLAHNTLLDSLTKLYHDEQTSVVLIAHDLMLAARYSTHVALFHDGQVLAGPTSQVFLPESLAKIYRLAPDLCEKLAGMTSDRDPATGARQ